ncbi:hypothetical protein, partial [Pseudomonas aeruginosa]|uniref:hypothetical protein n=1 Tax=Pseudomonas aeruginosa TaxID=287 RepID=UPI002B49A48F
MARIVRVACRWPGKPAPRASWSRCSTSYRRSSDKNNTSNVMNMIANTALLDPMETASVDELRQHQ